MSELIGYPIGYDQAERVQKGKVLPSAKKRLQIFSNYRGILEFTKSYNKTQSIPPSAELMQHINKLLTSRILEEWETGKIRSFSELPNEIYDTWYSNRDYYPELNTSQHFDDLSRWIFKKDDNIHKLIKLAIFTYEMIDKAPMLGANQLTTISLLSVYSKELDYNYESSFSFMKAINFIQDDLISAFKLSKGNRDLTIFIEAFLYALSLEMLNLENIYSTTFEQKVKQQGKLASKFNSRQLKILDYLENIDKITRNEYMKMMGISFMTAYRDLNNLVEEKYLESKGTGRGTFYRLVKKKDMQTEESPKKEIFGE
jgi:Fic family protein